MRFIEKHILLIVSLILLYVSVFVFFYTLQSIDFHTLAVDAIKEINSIKQEASK